jgi:hypothetical protein
MDYFQIIGPHNFHPGQPAGIAGVGYHPNPGRGDVPAFRRWCNGTHGPGIMNFPGTIMQVESTGFAVGAPMVVHTQGQTLGSVPTLPRVVPIKTGAVPPHIVPR